MNAAKVEPLLWTDDFCTGIATVDEQHRILVNMMNEANAKLYDDSEPELFEQITRDLLSYAIYHFETEEEVMQQSGYDGEKLSEYERHLQEHRAFSAQVVTIRDELKQGKAISRDTLLSFLYGWLSNHILVTDKRLGRYVTQKT